MTSPWVEREIWPFLKGSNISKTGETTPTKLYAYASLFNLYFFIGLSEEKGSWVASQWKANLGTFSRIAVGQSLTVNQLVDMEWRFGG